MLLQGSGVDKYIVKIGGDEGESSANHVHQSLERPERTTKPKWHANEFVQSHARSGGESSLGSIIGMNRELPVPTLQVQGRKYSQAYQSTLTVLVGPTASGGMCSPSWIPLCRFPNSCEQCTFTATGIAGRGLDIRRAVALNMPRPSASVTDTLCGSVLTSLRCEGCHLLCEGCQLLL